MTSALCWSHARRKFFELADIAGNVRKGKSAHEISPVALEAVKRIDALFDIERGLARGCRNCFPGSGGSTLRNRKPPDGPGHPRVQHRPRREDDRRKPRADPGRQLELRQHRLRRDDPCPRRDEDGITTFTDRGIESLQEFLADVRTWNGGIRQFLINEQCDPDVIERIMATEQES